MAAVPLPAMSASPSGGSAPATPTQGTTAPASSAAPASMSGITYAIPGLVPPGVSFGPKGTAKSSDSVVDTIDAAAAASVAAVAPARRRQRSKSKVRIGGQRYEYLEETAGMGARAEYSTETGATNRGAGKLGFAGTAPAATSAHTAGTVRFGSDDTRQVVPMLPSTWQTDSTEQ